MPDLIMYKAKGGLFPDMDEDSQYLCKVPDGEYLMAKVTRPRNIRLHRKFFALLNLAVQNQNKYNNVDQLLIAVKIKIGHFDMQITESGEVVYIPKSISFANMDDLEFDKFYNRVLTVICSDVITGADPDEIEARVIEILERFA